MKEVLTSLLILFSSTVYAHEWYPIDCCSGQDCKPVPCKELISQSDNLIKYNEDGRDYYFSSEQRRSSPDGMCHVCIAFSQPRCVFIPAGS